MKLTNASMKMLALHSFYSILNAMEIINSDQLVEYDDALSFMEQRVADIHAGHKDDAVWFLEHPSLYTAGTSAKEGDLLDDRFPVYKTGRGGQYTYHGPGQRVVYLILDLKRRQQQPDIKKYIWNLEEVIIRSLADFGITGERRHGRVGIWVVQGQSENKIAAIGVRVRHWVAYHGIAINLAPDLSHFGGIVPCGIQEHGVTSFEKLGVDCTMGQLDAAVETHIHALLGVHEMAG